jgi:acyl-CoA synthetase (AMP-forming)/AMP-acid ligase II
LRLHSLLQRCTSVLPPPPSPPLTSQIYYSILFLGIIAAGGVFAGTNPSYTPYELAHHIQTSETKFLITEPEMLPAIRAAAHLSSIPDSQIFIFDVRDQPLPAGFQSWTALLTHGEKDWLRFDDAHTAKTTTAARLFSSGTTGLPKAAVLSHYNLVAQHTLVHEHVAKPYEVRRTLCIPMFHAAAVPTAHTSALRSGHVSYIMRRFELAALLETFARFDITEIGIVPPIAIAIIMSPLTKNYSLKSIKAASCGAAPLAKETQRRFKDLLDPSATVTQVWGMTETSCVASMLHYPEDDETGSVGRMLPNVDAKLVDDTGNDISGYDVRGELCVRGPIVIAGYFDNAAANAACWDDDGFFHTGDIAYVSGETRLWHIVDRKKELIKVRGFQVAPPELEAVLLSHPQVVDAAVVGVRRRGERDGEQPRAFVVRRPGGEEVGEEELKRFCGERLARYKELTGGVVFLDEIPKNPSGKILKRVLREWVVKEEGGTKL